MADADVAQPPPTTTPPAPSPATQPESYAERESETTPLLPVASDPAPSPPTRSEQPRQPTKRSVTFNPNPVSRTIEPEPEPHPPRRRIPPSDAVHSAMSTGSLAGAPPMLASLNQRLRRRGSQANAATYGTITGGASGAAGGGPGSSAGLLPLPGGVGATGTPKIGPQRSTKNAQKLKLLPTPDPGDDGVDEESGRDVYSQYTRIKDPTARRDAARLGKADRNRLPRVTAYCTANRYQLDGLMRFLKGRRGRANGASPKLIDECIYTPYCYREPAPPPPHLTRRSAAGWANSSTGKNALGIRGTHDDGGDGSTAHSEVVTESSTHAERGHERSHFADEAGALSPRFGHDDLLDLGTPAPEALGYGGGGGSGAETNGELAGQEAAAALHTSVMDGALSEERSPQPADFDIHVHTPEVFLFAYGVVVIWGMTVAQEQRFLKEIAKFETEKLAAEEVETEFFNFYYTSEYQPRIYNDFITLRDKNNYMTKLAISHALGQSVKTSLFEELIASTIDTCKDIPTQIALTGKIALSRTQINMQIGELFILRISIHLNGSVLDTPELFWVEPQLEPVYQAVRSYLEMDQRVGLLTERLDVIADLLAVLKDQLSHGHGEKLEWIVIVLIAAEILVAAVNIVVDLYAGVD